MDGALAESFVVVKMKDPDDVMKTVVDVIMVGMEILVVNLVHTQILMLVMVMLVVVVLLIMVIL